ncbi:hypothetical protein QF001_000869 [Paraburkholderia youngii]|uniref:hypothetical protein n=1 Tax=Paraburkholderia youngii TaxID=2782701 RepID=UPI003D19FD04
MSNGAMMTDEQVRALIQRATEENGTGELMFTLVRVVERALLATAPLADTPPWHSPYQGVAGTAPVGYTAPLADAKSDERAAFEAWWNASDNAYKAVNMEWTEEACWFAWQARAQAPTTASALTDEQKSLIERAIRYIDFRWGPEDLVSGLRAFRDTKAVSSVAAHLWMPSEIAEPKSAPHDFGDRKAYAFKAPDAGEHDPWYVVLPNCQALKLGYHADDAIDRAHAEFIAAAINRALLAASGDQS